MANPPREVGAERRMAMKDYALPTIGNTTSCIVLVDNVVGGAMLERTLDEVYNIFEMLEANSQQKSVRTKRVEVNNAIGIPKNDGLVQINKESMQKEEKVEPNLRLEKKENEVFSRPEFHKAAQPYRLPIPFLNQPKESEKDKFFFENIEMLSKVNTNLPLLDVIRNKPAYTKNFEELNTSKRRYANNKKVQVASVMLQHQLPLKMKDPGSFTINIIIGDKKDTKVMLDLGASINLMPYSMYEVLDLRELKPTTMSLQFTDKSTKYPKVLDMENTPARDKKQTILLGRSFMATTRTVTDVHDGKLTMTVLGETVEFKVFDFLTLSPKSTIDKCSYNYLDFLVYEQLYNDILFLIDKSFRDTLDIRIKSIKPYLKGMAYDEEVECADECPP
ncbi:uncharacterized protein LOC125370324 [Ricinus communis]|uniref:uncharacterized protein LOC125370324 n=1 Tax=Ricinus communis TaxID=3988 RepID=UPI00201AF509|nr:uncharacterized protein LOC125370324 [Ricinus communis]